MTVHHPAARDGIYGAAMCISRGGMMVIAGQDSGTGSSVTGRRRDRLPRKAVIAQSLSVSIAVTCGHGRVAGQFKDEVKLLISLDGTETLICWD